MQATSALAVVLEKDAPGRLVVWVGRRGPQDDAAGRGRIGLGIPFVEPAGWIPPVFFQDGRYFGRATQNRLPFRHEDVGAVLAASVVSGSVGLASAATRVRHAVGDKGDLENSAIDTVDIGVTDVEVHERPDCGMDASRSEVL